MVGQRVDWLSPRVRSWRACEHLRRLRTRLDALGIVFGKGTLGEVCSVVTLAVNAFWRSRISTNASAGGREVILIALNASRWIEAIEA